MVLELNPETGEGFREIGQTMLDHEHADVPAAGRKAVLDMTLGAIAQTPDPSAYIAAALEAVRVGTLIHNENVRVQNKRMAAQFPPAAAPATPSVPATPLIRTTLRSAFASGFRQPLKEFADIIDGRIDDPRSSMTLQHKLARTFGIAAASAVTPHFKEHRDNIRNNLGIKKRHFWSRPIQPK